MKYLVLIGDGMADFPLAELNDRTPLAAARTPAMDALASEGLSGLFCPIPEKFKAGSDIGNLSLFGYDPEKAFTGRAPLEAANQGIAMGPGTLAFRCNLVTVEEGRMKDFTAGHISSGEAAEIIHSLDEKLGGRNTAFHAGVGYRHLITMNESERRLRNLAALDCTPPHDIIGQSCTPALPKGDGSAITIDLMDRAADVLRDHQVNVERQARGALPATSIWLWGQGLAPNLKTYAELFGLRGAVISAVDLVKGIGRCAGLNVIDVPGATGYVDTDYEGKVAAAIEALEEADFVYLHVEAPDEAAHEGDTALKIRAIEDFDRRVVEPGLNHAKSLGNCRVLVAPDHITALSTRTHAGGPVPFALWGPGVPKDGRTCYSETEAEKSGILFAEGHRLVPAMIAGGEFKTAM